MAYFEGKFSFNEEAFSDFSRTLSTFNKLGVENIIIEVGNPKEIQSNLLRNLLKEFQEVNFYYRINIKTEKVNEYRLKIKNYTSLPYFISVDSGNKDVQLKAAKNIRVDLLSFSSIHNLRTLSVGVLSLAQQYNTFIEFSLAPILVENRYIQSKNFRLLYKSIQLALKSKTDFIITGNFKKEYDCRHPRALMSLCYTLLDLPYHVAKNCFTKNIQSIINKRNNSNQFDLKNSDYRLFKRKEDLNERK